MREPCPKEGADSARDQAENPGENEPIYPEFLWIQPDEGVIRKKEPGIPFEEYGVKRCEKRVKIDEYSREDEDNQPHSQPTAI
jgi:hypothetical protein